jgi:aminocarboxymuconate-semialdehyde decarboxylase
MWYDTVGHGHGPALAAAAASFGSERLVLGTDLPYVRGEDHRRAITYLDDAGLEPAEREAVRDRNAASLLGLRGSSTTGDVSATRDR